jgi:glutaconate CoA-transferase subunit A
VGAGAGGPAVAAVPDLESVLAEAVVDGALVAFGGGELRRKPVAAARALAGLGRRDLRVAAMLGSVEVELLLAAGCVAELHSAGVALTGLAPRWREARQSGSPRVVEWSEGTFTAALQAAALGLDSCLWPTGVGTDLPAVNPWLVETTDPHTGAPVLAVRALVPDVAIIHAPGVDEHGNAYVDGDLVADELLSRAGRRVVVTYEELVPAEPARAAVSRLFVDDGVRAPGGAAPTACPPHYDVDPQGLQAL